MEFFGQKLKPGGNRELKWNRSLAPCKVAHVAAGPGGEVCDKTLKQLAKYQNHIGMH